jgi:sRNA-binding carbon storage regulator CsrA
MRRADLREGIEIYGRAKVFIMKIQADKAWLSIDAPDSVHVRRLELPERAEDTITDADRLHSALDELIKLYGHYAELLNQFDGGRRIRFHSAGEFLARLEAVRNPTPELLLKGVL